MPNELYCLYLEATLGGNAFSILSHHFHMVVSDLGQERLSVC